jgi:organic hydroperoxide reductase OsmC/OhrA
MNKEHYYSLEIEWTGNTGNGTKNYKTYERSHELRKENKVDIGLSSDPAFRGDNTKYNPEELLVASVSSCHMLWYLHLCSVEGINVLAYVDAPEGIMVENIDGSGKFTEITLKPKIKLENEEMKEKAIELHKKAHQFCFIANSCNFPIHHIATYYVGN